MVYGAEDAADLDMYGSYTLGTSVNQERHFLFNKKHAFIYYIECKGKDSYFKIGTSCRPYTRMCGLGLDPWGWSRRKLAIRVPVQYKFKIEHKVHEMLEEYKEWGEYFKIPEYHDPERVIVEAIYTAIREVANV